MRRGRTAPGVAALALLSITLGGSPDAVESFSPSAVSSTLTCRSQIIASPLHLRNNNPTQQPRRRRDAIRLHASPDEKERMSLLEPGSFPTITVDEPPQEQIYKEAIERTLLWVGLAGAFGAGLFVLAGPETSEEFFAGYLVEQSLSVDNLFVFLLLFEYFRVPLSSQDRVLNWGIYGAVVMRAVMIGVGAAALENFRAILLVFAGILVYSSAKTLIPGDDDEEEEDMNENAIVKFSRNLFDSTDEFDGSNFFTLVDGVKMATPLFICMIALEISDVVFAVDSIPAVFGVTENPLVVFSSNMFAIMGLRSLYTILSKAASDLKYLEPAVGIVLGFIGSKMIAEYLGFEIPTEAALAVVASLLSGGVGLSVWEKRQEKGINGETGG
ncbi:hypothetical protein ACHAXT_007862 [Thalassiosira profunda]